MLDELRGVKELATKTIFFYQLRALVSFNFNNEVTANTTGWSPA